MNRAYALLEIKSFDDEQRTFEGIASTPTVDHGGDSMDPMGAQFTLPMPMLWQHGKGAIKDPVGWITKAIASPNGIKVAGQMAKPKTDYPQPLKDELDGAWVKVRDKLVAGLSIGWVPIEAAPIKGTYNTRHTKWSWYETSAVSIGMNSEATITAVKSLDEAQRLAAIGHGAQGVVRITQLPGDSGSTILGSKGTAMTTQERITQWQAKRAATVAAMATLMKTAEDDGDRTLTKEEGDKHTELDGEVKSIDEHLARLEVQAKTVQETAKPVVEDKSDGIKIKAGEGVLRPNANLPKGIGLARYVKALAFAKGNNAEAQMYAKQWEDSTPEVLLALKTAIAAGTTADATWAGPLVYNQNLANEFLEFLRPQTILGKLDGLHRVPFNVRFATQTAGSTMGWVGEGLGKPVSKLALSSASLGFAKAAGIVVITQELARFSSPSAELVVRNDVTAQMKQFLDQQFIDPGVAAVANVNPASVLNGASNIVQATAAWTTMAAVVADVKTLLNTFATQEIALDSNTYWIMTPALAINLSLLPTAGGENFAFPGVSVSGGTFLGLPVIVSNGVPHSTSAGSILALIKADEILMADEGGIAIDTSTEASLLMDSAPTTQTSATPTGSSVVSMFQTNSIAIRCERIINWARRRTYGVGYIDNIH